MYQRSRSYGYSENIKNIVRKLPYYLHERWRTLVSKLKDEGKTVKFHDLTQFVKKEAKKTNDPTYGKAALAVNSTDTGKRGSFHNQRAKGSYATKLGDNKESKAQSSNASVTPNPVRTCSICKKGEHRVDKCDVFLAKNIQDRINLVKEAGMCFGCLRHGHRSKECRNRGTCQKCHKRHPTVLHRDEVPACRVEVERPESSKDMVLDITGSNPSCQTGAGNTICTMAIVPVLARSKRSGLSIETYAFMDPGSSVSFCTDELRKKLGLGGRKARITLDTMGTSHTLDTRIVTGIELSNLEATHTLELPNVYSKDSMPVSHVHIPRKKDIEEWPHMERVQLPDIDAQIGLLIGNAVAEAYTPLEIVTGPPGSPYASRTALGWIAWNVVRSKSSTNGCSAMTVNRIELEAIHEYENLNHIVKQAVSIDFPERKSDSIELSVDDRKFVKKVKEGIEFEDNHYRIPLPFKDESNLLPNNLTMAKKRYMLLEKRLERDSKLKEEYKAFIDKMINKGYAERVDSSCPPLVGKEWYLPHHPVYHPRKPDKLRVVYDCAAKYNGIALNDVLLQGPDLTNSLVEVLLGFREERVALMADIEGMFLQVVVPEKDRDVLRFLWKEGGELAVYRMTRHLFGATSSPSCANTALRRTANDHGHKYSSKASEAIKHHFFVDDCLVSVGNDDEAIELITNLTGLCRDGGFRLTKWMSNSKTAVNSIPDDEKSPDLKNLDLANESLPAGRALGVCWSPESDVLSFDISPSERPYTRRGLLSIISSVFDPLGLVCPFILPAKILLQELCRKGMEWDETIEGPDLQRWRQWLTELPRLKEWNVARCYKAKVNEVVSRQLHMFCDASDKGYGIAAYLRQADKEGVVECSLVLARSRVTPLKYVSIPRLELAAAVMAVRLAGVVEEKLHSIDEIVYWTDSQTVLRYINNTTKRFRAFVANRVALIIESSNPAQWRYVHTSSNPADDASRGLSIGEFLKNDRWINGPRFLLESSANWPGMREMANISTIAADDPEVKREVSAAVGIEPVPVMERLLERYSSFHKLKRIVAWLLILKENLRRRAKGKANGTCVKYLQLEHLQVAEKAIVMCIQEKYYSKEIAAIQSTGENTLRESPLRKLDPVLQDGMLRVGGRLDKSGLPEDMKHPILIPRQSPIAEAIILDIHKEIGHLGRNAVLGSLRERFWIPGAITTIRSVLSRCVSCRKQRAPPGEQKMAALPMERVQADLPPFHNTGMDMFGPFEVKRARNLIKRYGLIFTCLSSRAIHLEMVNSMDTDSCLNAMRRFIARRGMVASITSDNGTNFVGAERELREAVNAWNSSNIPAWLNQRNIKWNFNPPAASHFGGVWERQIRTVRQVMKGVLKEQHLKLDDEGLHTLFCETEVIVNGIPLTTVSSEPNDLNPLTPAMLLNQRQYQAMPPGIFNQRDTYARRRWRQVQYLSDLFWVRFRKEYLPTLQERQKWLRSRRNLQVGDIVLVVDNTLPRNSWLMARVTEVRKDKKGFVRSCTVKTKSSTLERPIAKLCLLLEADHNDQKK